MKNRVVTISREFGSGGRTIGKQAAQMLGIPCYDSELIEKLAEESGFTQDYVEERSEYAERAGFFSNAFSTRAFNGVSNQDYLWGIQQKLIVDLAARESCVIVGRCADYILRDKAQCLRAFIHADLEKRAERIVKIYGETESAPEKRLRDKDKRRAAFYQFYTDLGWGQAKNYHITLDSGVFGIDRCAAIIAGLYKAM